WQDDLAACAVPAGLLRQGLRRPHRRSEHRLERPGAMDHQRRPDAMADGRRQGKPAPGGALPAAARSAGALSGAEKSAAVARAARSACCLSWSDAAAEADTIIARCLGW